MILCWLKILPEEYQLEINCFIRPHQGKSDLQKSIPVKDSTYRVKMYNDIVYNSFIVKEYYWPFNRMTKLKKDRQNEIIDYLLN